MRTLKQTLYSKQIKVLIYTLNTINERDIENNFRSKYWAHAGNYVKAEYLSTKDELISIYRKIYPDHTTYSFYSTLNEALIGGDRCPEKIWVVPSGLTLILKHKPKKCNSKKKQREYYCDCIRCCKRKRSTGSAGKTTAKLKISGSTVGEFQYKIHGPLIFNADLDY